MGNLIFTGFGGFERGLKNSTRNHKRRMNKFDDIKVINFCSRKKVSQMGKYIIFSATKARANKEVI